MARLSPSEIYTLLLQGGFSPDQARTMTAIAQAESARNLNAIGDVALENNRWGPSVGLFQIRTLKAQTGTGGDRDIRHLLNDPVAQVKAAFDISGSGQNFRPWSTFTSGSYRKFLDTPLQAGVALNLPVGGKDPFAIDAGVQPSSSVDSDRDGLTDQFEALLGTDPHSADTDHDGLSDVYETTVSHTDPLSADTDHDGTADGVEVAHGTDPGHVDLPAAAAAAGFGGLQTQDSDHDGLSDAFERAHGTNPLDKDSDHDGLSDAAEFARSTNPLDPDSNHDGITDGFAAAHGLLGPLPGDTPGMGQGLGTGLGTGLGQGMGAGLGGGLGTGLGVEPGLDPTTDPMVDPTSADHH